jgi:hypothetical protein
MAMNVMARIQTPATLARETVDPTPNNTRMARPFQFAFKGPWRRARLLMSLLSTAINEPARN